MSIGAFLRSQREYLGLSIQEIADELTRRGFPITKQTVSNWENSRTVPPLEDGSFRLKLASTLQTDNMTMLYEMGYIDHPETQYSREARRAAQIMDDLTPQGKIIALQLLQVLEREFLNSGS
jgi:transcriptional regulator with XRE-family HTH domain